MTTARDSRAQALNAIAAVMHAIRDGWDTPGCAAALRKVHPNITLAALLIAVGRYSADPRNLTPAHIADLANHAWDDDGYPPCPVHGNVPRRVSGECAHCWADRNGDETSTAARKATPPPRPLRELVGDTRGSAPAAGSCPASRGTVDG